MRRMYHALAVILLLPLAGCIVSEQDLLAGQPGATPLPDAFILISQDTEKPDGGYVRREGDRYVATDNGKEEAYRLAALEAGGGSYFIGIARDETGEKGEETFYALVRIEDEELAMVSIDADWLKQDQNSDTEEWFPLFLFETRAELEAMFTRAVAEMGRHDDWVDDDSRFRIYDLSDRAQKEAGEKRLAEIAEAKKAREEQ